MTNSVTISINYVQSSSLPFKAIILIGPPGCGKTTCGKALASYLGWTFLDTDQAIESKTGSTISRIFHESGEDYFRKLESKLIDELLLVNLTHDSQNPSGHVIAAGGGMPIPPANMMRLKKLGKVFFLMASSSCLVNRLQGQNHRPLLPMSSQPSNKELALCLDKLLESRWEAYSQAHFKIETSNLSPHEVVHKMLLNLDICT